jgi:hypothetical protein
MGILTALVPWPYRILAMVLLVAAVVGTAYFKGRSAEADANDERNHKAEVQMLKAQAGKQKRVSAVTTQSKVRTAKLEVIAGSLTAKAKEHESLPDRDVELPPERLRNILSAWGVSPRAGAERPDGPMHGSNGAASK